MDFGTIYCIIASDTCVCFSIVVRWNTLIEKACTFPPFIFVLILAMYQVGLQNSELK